jgi:mannitol/fructose-specific phosphotransferase system IIA component (Ntr-type)
MKFSDFICKDAIRTQLKADEKETVIRAMAQSLVDAGKIKQGDFESIVAAISDEGVDFDSLDGEKVHLLFLLISPPDRPGDHLRALENISRQLRDDSFCRFLKQSKSPQDVWQLLEEGDSHQTSA